MPRRPTITLLSVLGLGCAASGSAPVTDSAETVSRIIWEGGVTTEMHNNPAVGSAHVPAPTDSVLLALPRVYEILGIADAGIDAGGTLYGNPSFRPRRLEGKRLSTYIDCGSGATAVPYADSYEVTMSVVTRVTPAEAGGTIVGTIIDALAKPRAVAGNPLHCQSKGVLESRVSQLVLYVVVGGQ